MGFVVNLLLLRQEKLLYLELPFLAFLLRANSQRHHLLLSPSIIFSCSSPSLSRAFISPASYTDQSSGSNCLLIEKSDTESLEVICKKHPVLSPLFLAHQHSTSHPGQQLHPGFLLLQTAHFSLYPTRWGTAR